MLALDAYSRRLGGDFGAGLDQLIDHGLERFRAHARE